MNIDYAVSLRGEGRTFSRWNRYGYRLPSSVYEATVLSLAGGSWLDVGGGKCPFPDNRRLCEEVAGRFAVIDPSPNVLDNPYTHDKTCGHLDSFQREPFDLVTLRMVAEHVAEPESFCANLSRLTKPGGHVVVFTVSKWSPLSLLARMVPFGLHHRIKAMFWGGSEDDSFPVQYRMNTRIALLGHFAKAGFEEVEFHRLDDLSTFSLFNWLGAIELLAWRCLRLLGIGYPECCLLGVYRRLP